MTATASDGSQQTAAKVAGVTTLFTMAIVVIANFGIRERLIVARGAVAVGAVESEAHVGVFVARLSRPVRPPILIAPAEPAPEPAVVGGCRIPYHDGRARRRIEP